MDFVDLHGHCDTRSTDLLSFFIMVLHELALISDFLKPELVHRYRGKEEDTLIFSTDF